MADAALVRREARRRKILENSHNRLQKISGKADDGSCKESPVHSPIPDYQNVVSSEASRNKTPLLNGMLSSSTLSSESLDLPSQDIVNHDQVINDLTSLLPPNFSSNTSSEAIQKSSLLENLVCYKYDIVLLSLFIQVLNSLSIISIENTYFFLPLFVYAGTKMYWFPKQTNNSNFANVLMLLKGISTHRIQNILNLMQKVGAIGLDASVFVFSTTCIQVLYIFITTYVIT